MTKTNISKLNLKDKIATMREKKYAINDLYTAQRYDDFFIATKRFYNEYFVDVDILNLEVMVLYGLGKIHDAIKLTEKNMHINNYNPDTFYNLGFLYSEIGDYKKSYFYHKKSKRMKLAEINASTQQEVEEFSNACLESIHHIIEKIDDDVFIEKVDKYFDNNTHPISFPSIDDDHTYFNEFIVSTNNYEDFSLHIETDIEKDFASHYHTFIIDEHSPRKTEIVKGNYFYNYHQTIEVDCFLPIKLPIWSDANDSDSIDIYINEDKFPLKSSDEIAYIPLRKNDQVKISSNLKFFVGKLFERQFESKESIRHPKLVFSIFIDGLSQKFLNQEGFCNLMPYTSNFFEKGKKYLNVHANNDWTLPSIASIYTGMPATKHHVFHHIKDVSISDQETFPSVFKKEGYLCFQMSSNWRKNPLYGYSKDFDRTIYDKNYSTTKTLEDIDEIIEHINMFKDRNHFIWLDCMSLHSVVDGFSQRIYDNGILDHKEVLSEMKNPCKSVYTKYNEKLIKKYSSGIKRLDRQLNYLYDYLKNNYDESEYAIVLFSDHGQTFLSADRHLLKDFRTQIPCLMKYGNTSYKDNHELFNGSDIKLLFQETILDNNVTTSKEYIYTEILYCIKRYQARILSEKYEFKFNTMEHVTTDGKIPFGDFECQLINRKTQMDVTEYEEEQVEKYLDIVYEHIKDLIVIV